MCPYFPLHDASTFPQIVCETPKDKSACRARFSWLLVQRGCSEREIGSLRSNVQEWAAFLGSAPEPPFRSRLAR